MSAKGLASILAALGAGMSGYAKGQEIRQNNERRKVTDAREDEQYARGQAKQAKADELETNLVTSQQDQVVENVPSYDISQMNGGDPSKQPTVAYKAGGQTFADQAAAQAALHGANSRAEKDRRAAQVLRTSGDPAMIDRARQMEEFAAKAIGEGTDQILGAIQSSAPPLDAVKKAGGKVAGTVGQQAAETFNQVGGKWKVSADTMVEHFVDKDATGREFVNQRVLGKDGKPVVDDVHNASRMLLSVKERMAAQNDDQRTFLSAQQQAEQSRHNGVAERLDEKRVNASIADSAAQRGIAQQRLNMEKQSFKKQGLVGQIADIEAATGVKLTADEKKVLAGIKPGKGVKDADAVGAKIVESAVKTYQENTPNATTAQIATFRANLERDMTAARDNLQVDAALKSELGGKDPGSPGYAQAWNEAKTIGLTDQDLVAKGYKPPAKMVPNPVAASVGAGARPAAAANSANIPSPPKEKEWVGNKHVVTPAYTEWEQKYGAEYRRRSAAEQQRLIGAMERVRN
jgi:hypothetical protein